MKPVSFYQNANFLLSAPNSTHMPKDEGFEVAFAGRSNSGKSSVINTITYKKKLARTSKTPGCTQLINFFALDDTHRLVDLPGYGYAKVPLPIKQRWQKNLVHYLQTRQSLKGLILIMDVRHPLTPLDWQLLDGCPLPVHVLLTKMDKLSYSKMHTVLRQVRIQLDSLPNQISVQLFSSLKRVGIEEVHHYLNFWLNIKSLQDDEN